MKNNPLPRLDTDTNLRDKLLPFCRLSYGEVWIDPASGHKVGCLDAANAFDVTRLMGNEVVGFRSEQFTLRLVRR